MATLLLPVHAPWSKAAEVIDYVRAVHADQAYAVHDGLLNDTGLGRRRRAAGRARAGHAHARTAGWPRGTRSSSDARPGPPGIGSADGAAALPPVTPSATPISRTAAMTAMMKPTTFSSKMLVFVVEQVADQAADDGADDAAARSVARTLRCCCPGLIEPGEHADDEADHDQADDLHSVLLRSSGAAPVPARRRVRTPVHERGSTPAGAI